MVVTMLEATVGSERVEELERGYRELVAELPDAIVETFLLRDADDEGRYTLTTVWRSRDALREMQAQTRRAGTKPGGVVLLESVGATPSLRVFDVAERAVR